MGCRSHTDGDHSGHYIGYLRSHKEGYHSAIMYATIGAKTGSVFLVIM
jgi:hypothetical protein